MSDAASPSSPALGDEGPTLGLGFHFEDLPLGTRFRTTGRTITETDLVAFVNLSWFTEELFTNTADRAHMAIQGRVVPGRWSMPAPRGCSPPPCSAPASPSSMPRWT